MTTRSSLFVAFALSALPGTAGAHVGAAVAKALFTTPAGPVTTADGDHDDVAPPFTFSKADQSFTVAWTDGDIDPTGRFTFYYLDHDPAVQVPPDAIERIGTPISNADGIWVSCTCTTNGDAGILCPDAGSRAGQCANSFVWDTSGVPAGSYWIAAVNRDPPYYTYNTTDGPVLVSHGSDVPPPAVIVLRPDGFMSFDQSYLTQWLAVGPPPLTYDLEYGLNDLDHSTDPTTPIASAVATMANADGTVSYNWDISGLISRDQYYLRVRVTDGLGRKVYSDSRLGLNVFHRDDDGAIPFDLRGTDQARFVLPVQHDGGCGVDGGRADALLPAAAVGLVLVLVLWARRRA